MSADLHRYVHDADTFKDAMAVELERLSRLRLEDWAEKFKAKFPRQHGKVTFGMGSEYVEFGGKQYNSWDVEKYRVLKPFFAAIEDVWTITDNYKLACPEDFKW